MTEAKRKAVHINYSEKGGIGKSVSSSMLAQYYEHKGKSTLCLDCDPYNASLFKYKGLNAEHFMILNEDKKFMPEVFDQMMMKIFETDEEVYIIDNGTSAYMQMSKYIYDDKVLEELMANDIDVFIHTIVVKDGELPLMVKNMDQICDAWGETGAKIVVWENQYKGAVTKDGKSFEEFAVYKKHKANIYAHIKTKELEELGQKTVDQLFEQKMTFKELEDTDKFNVMQKSRLKRLWASYIDMFDEAGLI